MKTLSGRKLTFEKVAVEKLSEGERKILYVFPHILNRLQMQQAQLFGHLYTAANSSISEYYRGPALFGAIESFILIAGELKEVWEAIDKCYYKSTVSKSMNSDLDPEVQKTLKDMKDYFKGDGLLAYLRNNFAFHHSSDHVLDTATLDGDDETHVIFLLENDANYFDYAEKRRLSAIAKYLQTTNPEEILNHLVEEIINRGLVDVCKVLNEILMALFRRIVPIEEDNFSIEDVKRDSELGSLFYFYREE